MAPVPVLLVGTMLASPAASIDVSFHGRSRFRPYTKRRT